MYKPRKSSIQWYIHKKDQTKCKKVTKKDVHEDDISFTLKAEGIPITFNATEDTYTYGPMTLVSTADCDKCIIDYGCGTMPLSVKKRK